MLNFFGLFRRLTKEPSSGGLRDALKQKYLSFEALLRENNRILSLMADMEEKLAGEYIFDRHYVEGGIRAISDGVRNIVESLNALSYNKYGKLRDVHEGIKTETEKALSSRTAIPLTDLVVPLSGLSADMFDAAGGKMANLGEVHGRIGLAVPDGFAVTARAFQRYMEHNGLPEKIQAALSSATMEDIDRLRKLSTEIQSVVSDAEIPADLRDSVIGAYEALCDRAGERVSVSVRSSAVHEDREFSFAGQYATYLNVPGEAILHKYKDVVASLFTPRALFYCKTKGFYLEDMVMAVGVLRMIEARAAGVMYTKDPNDPESGKLIINAVRGLGKPVVDGTAEASSFLVSSEDTTLLHSTTPTQRTMLVCGPEGCEEAAVPESDASGPCLSGEQIRLLSAYAASLEKHFSGPQDVEWAIGPDGIAYVLQSRPLRTLNVRAPDIPRKIEGRNAVITRGVIACKGVGFGKAFILRHDDDLASFPDGAVLVAKHTSTKFVTVMERASAIVTEVGSATGHMASLSREYGVPTILDAGAAASLLRDGQELTVDAFNGNVYEGRVEELLEHARKRQEPFRNTRLFATLERVLKLTVPLTLIDPDSENFRAECCRTFHDITRFAHEMAMAEIFKTGKGQTLGTLEDVLSAIAFAEAGEANRLGTQTSALRAGIPVDAHLLDIDGGITRRSRKIVPEDIASVPFSAFLRGMTVMKWPEPRPVDAGGFLGMVARTASMPETELLKMGGRSYAIVSRNYMNFSIRLGYHFSMVESYVGENINDNYIKFFFKGGGAALDRRLRRVRLIAEILRRLGFRVSVTKDVIDAMLAKYRPPDIEATLEAMGKLTAYTKQLDMALFNDSIMEMFIEEFAEKHLKAFRP